MPFLPDKPFNPRVTKVPIIDSSSGNPTSFQDPNSVASAGAKIQAMIDQVQADTLYDTPPIIKEGFRNEVYNPWILRTEACREGFSRNLARTAADFTPPNNYILLGIAGALVVALYMKRR